MQIKINIKNDGIKLPKAIVDAAGGDELIARIFYNRGYKQPEVIRQMLDETQYTPTSIDEFPDMDIAVERIARALADKEQIAVYGDYDVDGVTSTVTLIECLRMLGGNVIYHVPDRFSEGYGMNEEVVRSLKNKGTTLIITCDCGVSNHNEIITAKSLGMDVIVTDHHNIPDQLPPADVVLNPKLLAEGHRARNISGCGMAYFLCKALLKRYHCEDKANRFLDLLALSLVADVVSLNGENRYLLRKAMQELFNSKRTGMKALFSVIEKNVKMENEEDIAFQIAPRINAAGRMDSARLPVDMFLSSHLQEAVKLAERIDALNKERKKVQQEIIDQAFQMVENGKKSKTILVLYNKFWHHGIIGIAAGKLCETYRKPVILLSMKEDGHTIVGSARSTEEINIYELIKESGSSLLKFGGHSAAAGLSLEEGRLETFTREIESLAERKYFIKDIVQVNVDMALDIDNIQEEIYDKLRSIGPYGEGFEQPVFFSSNVCIVSDRKTDKNHHIMVLSGNKDTRLQAVKWFGEDALFEGKSFDIVYSIGKNNYSGNGQLQLTIDTMLENAGGLKKAYEGEFIDARGTGIEELLERYEKAMVFYEGLGSACPIKQVCNRNEIRRAETLILLSTPVNTSILKEIVYLANPERVVLNFSVLPDYTFKGFLFSTMSILKFIIVNRRGRVYLEDLAARLCVETGIVKSVLKYLKAAGKIEYFMELDERQVYIEAENRTVSPDISLMERNLKNALDEKNAYQQFLLKLETRKFKEYLK
ncbi:MAG: single-stranded-DNA-specific exonuclease RecJ [Clostridia bacterium]|nr:single-stranded-DNA-specific exonuclease RecJ [Clostridia bacterium]